MTTPILQYAFVSGEISPSLYARSDLQKYDLGVAEAYNFFVDYRGGLSTRPGFEFGVEIPDATSTTKTFKFEFGTDVANTYLLLFGDSYVRFIQDNGYVVESAKTISGATQANPGVITATSHGYSNGDLVYIDSVGGMTELNGRYFLVAGATTNTFELHNLQDDTVNTSAYTAYTSGGSVYRIYTVTTPYSASDLENLKVDQRRDTVTLTHPDYAPRELVRSAATSWSLSTITFATDVPTPSGVNATSSGSGTAEVGFIVTAVKEGKESLPSDMDIVTGAINYTATAGSMKITWNKVNDVDYYNVYRTGVSPTANTITAADQVGFIGRAFGTQFTDPNIVPDFTKTPPRYYNPFAAGAVRYINVTAGGSGYTHGSATVSVSGGGGSGFSGFPIVNPSGAIIGVIVKNGGSGYSSPTVSFGGGGSGATATASLSPATGVNPRSSTIFQQRRVFGGTDEQPLGVFGTKPGEYSNMDFSFIVTDGDSYEFELDAQRVSPITSFIALQAGLVSFTKAGVWNVTGGSDEATITPLNVLARPQTYAGSSTIQPIPIDNDILYVQEAGSVVRALAYSFYSELYTGTDISILANHLFANNKRIVSWDYAQDPYYLIWCVRNDGIMLAFTYVKEQDVYAWTRVETNGIVKDVTVIREGRRSSPYITVERNIDGVWRRFIERVAEREGTEAETYMCVDSALGYGATPLTTTLRPGSAEKGTGVTFTADSASFTAGNVGDVIRVGGGKATITAYTSSTEVTCTITRTITDVLPSGLPRPSNSWLMATPVTSVSGLWHLEGESVNVLADGEVFLNKTVTNGTITGLTNNPSLVFVGLEYSCKIKTLPGVLPQALVEGLRKRIHSINFRVNFSRGLKIGRTVESAKSVKWRTVEDYDQATSLFSGAKEQVIPHTYDREGQVWFVVTDPTPTTLLGYRLNIDVGDDEN
jgi:hypothetical protein